MMDLLAKKPGAMVHTKYHCTIPDGSHQNNHHTNDCQRPVMDKALEVKVKKKVFDIHKNNNNKNILQKYFFYFSKIDLY